MRLYHIVSGSLLLPIIVLAAAAPVLVQVKRQVAIDPHIPEDSMTMFGKRGNELGELSEVWPELFRDSESINQGEASATRPSSISQPPLPDNSMAVEKLPPSVPEVPSQVPNPDHAQPLRGGDWDEPLINFFGYTDHSFENPAWSSTRPSSSSQPSGPTGGSMDIEQMLQFIHDDEPLHVSSSDSPSSISRPPEPVGGSAAVDIPQPPFPEPLPVSSGLSSTKPKKKKKKPVKPPSTSEEPPQVSNSDDEQLRKENSMNLWRGIVSDVKKNTYTIPTATPPSSSSKLKPIAIEKTLPSISKEPSKVSLNVIGHPEGQSSSNPEILSATHPPSISEPLGPAGGLETVEEVAPSIPEKPLKVSNRGKRIVPYWMQRMLIMMEAKPGYTIPTVTSPLSSSQPLEPARGSVAAKRPRPPKPKPSLESSSLSSTKPKRTRKKKKTDPVPSKTSLNVIGHPEGQSSSNPEMLSATHPPSISEPLGPADGLGAVEKLVPSIPQESSQESSSHDASLTAYDEMNKMWFNLIGQTKDRFGKTPEELSVAYPSQASSSPGLESPVADYEMGRVGSPPRPGPLSLTESDHMSTNPGG